MDLPLHYRHLRCPCDLTLVAIHSERIHRFEYFARSGWQASPYYQVHSHCIDSKNRIILWFQEALGLICRYLELQGLRELHARPVYHCEGSMRWPKCWHPELWGSGAWSSIRGSERSARSAGISSGLHGYHLHDLKINTWSYCWGLCSRTWANN